MDRHQSYKNFEKELVKQQTLADNVTSFRPYPFPGQLIHVPYPLDEHRRPLTPCRIPEYSMVRRFDLPTCFHGRDVRVVIKDPYEDDDCYVTLECDVTEPGETRCPFLINVTALLRHDDDMDFCLYRLRSYSANSSRDRMDSSEDEYSSDDSSTESLSSNDDVSSACEEQDTTNQFSMQVVDGEQEEHAMEDLSPASPATNETRWI